MEKPFKFRYANEIVGGVVFAVLIMLVAGIFIAGHAQGWFEKKAVLKTAFNTDDGAFGLREGDEVRIRDTVAGNVGKISPMPDGTIQATYLIKYQFLSHLKKGSIAKIRKKFALAGDSIVEIQIGKGDPMEDGDMIESKKDEELVDKANKALTEIQNVVMPITREMTDLLANLNKIAANLDKGEGVAGALLKDQELAKELKKVVGNVNTLVSDTRSTIKETTKLIKGVQKHWLWRKYMTKDKAPELLVPTGAVKQDLDDDIQTFRAELVEVRAANDKDAIARTAYNLAVCLMEKNDISSAIPMIHESRGELSALKKDPSCTYVLEAIALKKGGKLKEALESAEEALKMLNRSTDRGVALQCHVVVADILREKGDLPSARKEMKKVDSLMDKIESPAIMSVGAGGAARLYLAEDKPAEAAERFDFEAEMLRQAGLYVKMAESLEFAGNSYRIALSDVSAADRYYRAGRSHFAAENIENATKDLNIAADLAAKAKETGLSLRISELQRELSSYQPEPR